MQYIRGAGFDALFELEKLKDLNMSPDQAYAYVSLLASISEMDSGGFNAAHHAWSQEGIDEIWTFEDKPIRCAIHVPGDGRTQVRHVTLLATEFLDNPESNNSKANFVEHARQRLNQGNAVPWV